MDRPSSTPPERRSIDDYAHGLFRPHGQVELWLEGSVLRIVAEGPFNREAVQAVSRAMHDLLAGVMPGKPFAVLLEMRVSLLASPDALAAFEEFLRTMSGAQIAPKVVAYVVAPDIECRSLMLPLYAAIYARHQRLFAAFETQAEAEAWLRTQLTSL